MRFFFLIKRIKCLAFFKIISYRFPSSVCFKSDVEKAGGKHMFVEEESDFVSFVPNTAFFHTFGQYLHIH